MLLIFGAGSTWASPSGVYGNVFFGVSIHVLYKLY